MSDEITSSKRNTEEPKRFSTIKSQRAKDKKKKKKNSPMATAAEDENWAIISTGSFWEWRQKNCYKRVGLNQFNTWQIIFQRHYTNILQT